MLQAPEPEDEGQRPTEAVQDTSASNLRHNAQTPPETVAVHAVPEFGTLPPPSDDAAPDSSSNPDARRHRHRRKRSAGHRWRKMLSRSRLATTLSKIGIAVLILIALTALCYFILMPLARVITEAQ